jgi:hypothetical protein
MAGNEEKFGRRGNDKPSLDQLKKNWKKGKEIFGKAVDGVEKAWEDGAEARKGMQIELMKKVLTKEDMAKIETFLVRFSGKKGVDPLVRKHVFELAEAGIEMDFSLIRFLVMLPKKSKNPKFVKLLIDLCYTGMCDRMGDLVYSLPDDIAEKPYYVDALKKLAGAGLKIDGESVLAFSSEKAKDPHYVEIVYELLKKGVPFGSYSFSVFTPEKAHDENFMKVVDRFLADGIVVNGEVLEQLTPKRTADDKYIGVLIRLYENGVGKQDSNFGMDGQMLVELTTDKSQDEKYLRTLIELQKSGIDIKANEVKTLSISDAKDKEFVESLKVLQKFNVNVDSSLIKTLTSGTKEERRVMARNLKELSQSGLKIDSGMTYHLTKPKLTAPLYVESLKKLVRAGVQTDQSVVGALTLEKGSDGRFVQALTEIDSNFKKGSFYTIVSYLSTEQTSDADYVDTLKEVYEKTELRSELPRYLTLSRTRDAGYMKLFREHMPTKKEGSFYIGTDSEFIWGIDYLYMREVAGVPGDLLDNLYGDGSESLRRPYKELVRDKFVGIFNFKKDNLVTPVAEEIFDKFIKKNALPFIREINDLHNESVETRQEVVKGLPIDGLYTLVVHGEEELFTSSFRKVLFPLVMRKMAEEEMDAVDLIKFADPNKAHFRTFVQVFSKFNKLTPFLDTITDSEKKSAFLKEFVSGLTGGADGLKNAVSISETIGALRSEKELTGELEKYLIEAYRGSHDDAKILYGIIASMHELDSQTNKSFFKEAFDKYSVRAPTTIEHKELVNKGGEVVQQYFFYDDSDGHSSYESFLRTYGVWDKKSSGGWEKTEFDNYVVLKKVAGKITILKYANKPGNEYDGVSDIEDALKKKDLSTIEIVHRGHSYHVDDTLDRIPSIARIVYLGSCGGFGNIQRVLELAPDAHIIATKGEGTKVVNDPLLRMIDDAILKGKGVNWDDVWEKADRKFRDKRFQDYVSPSRNAAAILIKAFREHGGRE